MRDLVWMRQLHLGRIGQDCIADMLHGPDGWYWRRDDGAESQRWESRGEAWLAVGLTWTAP